MILIKDANFMELIRAYHSCLPKENYIYKYNHQSLAKTFPVFFLDILLFSYNHQQSNYLLH